MNWFMDKAMFPLMMVMLIILLASLGVTIYQGWENSQPGSRYQRHIDNWQNIAETTGGRLDHYVVEQHTSLMLVGKVLVPHTVTTYGWRVILPDGRQIIDKEDCQ